MAKKKPPPMDGKSANPGDRLKHALLLEVLGMANEWPAINYSETHAGAGVYLAERQSGEKYKYIENLHSLVTQTEVPTDPLPGTVYLRSLKQWWRGGENKGKYPGSVILARQWLKDNVDESRWTMRVTEADQATFERLRKALGGANGDVARHSSFAERIDWLTEKDNLILLVDPFAIVRKFTGVKGINDGCIDHEMVRTILKRLEGKEEI